MKPKIKDRIKLGLCFRCGEQPIKSNKLCTNCKEKQTNYNRQKRKDRISKGLCSNCGVRPLSTGSTCAHCIKYQRKRWNAFISNGICGDCGKEPLSSATRCQNCLNKDSEVRKQMKHLVYKNYGDACQCCGEKEEAFLSIDHINNDGKSQRQFKHPYSGVNLYNWIIKNNYPKDLQILCHNCQWGKRTYGICPHQKKPL